MKGLTRRVPSNKDGGGVPRRCRVRREAIASSLLVAMLPRPFSGTQQAEFRPCVGSFLKSRNRQSRRGSPCADSCVQAGLWSRCRARSYLRRVSVDRRTPARRREWSNVPYAPATHRGHQPLPLPLRRTRPSPATGQARDVLVQTARVRLIGLRRNQGAVRSDCSIPGCNRITFRSTLCWCRT